MKKISEKGTWVDLRSHAACQIFLRFFLYCIKCPLLGLRNVSELIFVSISREHKNVICPFLCTFQFSELIYLNFQSSFFFRYISKMFNFFSLLSHHSCFTEHIFLFPSCTCLFCSRDITGIFFDLLFSFFLK